MGLGAGAWSESSSGFTRGRFKGGGKGRGKEFHREQEGGWFQLRVGNRHREMHRRIETEVRDP